MTPCQQAVLRACVQAEQRSFAAISPADWWRADHPFRGQRAAFGAHLRNLSRDGYLHRHATRAAGYALTSKGRDAA